MVSLSLCLVSSYAVWAGPPKARTIAPEWRVNLRPSVGGDPLPVIILGGKGAREHKGLFPETSLRFVGNNALVATYVIRRRGSGSSSEPPHRGDSQEWPLEVRAVFVNTATGKIQTNPVWPTLHRYSKIVAAHDGRFVLQRGNDLTLYSLDDLSPLQELRLPEFKVENFIPYWSAISTPSGREILFQGPDDSSTKDRPYSSWIWVDTDSLRILHFWRKQPNYGRISITDDDIAVITSCTFAGCQPALKLRGLTTEWKSLGPTDDQGVALVTDDVLLRGGNARAGKPIRLVRSDGTLLWSIEQPKPNSAFSWGTALVSTGGRRLLVLGYRTKGKFEALDLAGHSVVDRVLIYDLGTDGEPSTLRIHGPEVTPLAVALSPDGTKLAILDQREALLLFQLPPIGGLRESTRE